MLINKVQKDRRRRSSDIGAADTMANVVNWAAGTSVFKVSLCLTTSRARTDGRSWWENRMHVFLQADREVKLVSWAWLLSHYRLEI